MWLLKCLFFKYETICFIFIPLLFSTLSFLHCVDNYFLKHFWKSLFQMTLKVKNLPTNMGDKCGFAPWVRKIPWRRAWQPTPVFLPGESHWQRSLAGYSPWGCKDLDTTERLKHSKGLAHGIKCSWGPCWSPSSLCVWQCKVTALNTARFLSTNCGSVSREETHQGAKDCAAFSKPSSRCQQSVNHLESRVQARLLQPCL